ncbi:MAG: ChaN family lipoprotein [Gallionella sp.]
MKILNALILALASCCAACATLEHGRGGFQLPVPKSGSNVKPTTFDLRDPRKTDELSDKLIEKRALFIGEIHDRPEHHQNQLRLIQNLYERYPNIVIGVEYFQQPFQTYLDDYLAGRIDEREMLIRTEYFKRWKIDYRMLQPILRFAREKHIPVLALNISDEIHTKVFHGGLKSLTPQERTHIPDDIQPIGNDYRNRLQTIFNAHPEGDSFESFVEGQQLWDEAMADVAANYLNDHPQTFLVVLAGLGHMMYHDGIPKALDRRLGGRLSAVAINGNQFGEFPGIADFLLAATSTDALPKPGKLGISIEDGKSDVRITELIPDGAADEAGINSGDHIVALEGMKVTNIAELKAVMFDKRPGDAVSVTVRREHLLSGEKELQFNVTLR